LDGEKMTIHIETKAGMSDKVLDILNGLKDVVIDKIEVQDQAYKEKQNELTNIYQNAINKPDSLKSHDEVWKDIEGHSR